MAKEPLVIRGPANGGIGADIPRVDGIAKVTGTACYAADYPIKNVAHAYLATSAIARGRIRSIDQREARRREGVLEILTHENVGDEIPGGMHMFSGGYMGSSWAPLGGAGAHYADQIVAVVVAETFEIARDAALALEFQFDEEQPTATFDCPGAEPIPAKATSETEIDIGNFGEAWASSFARIDQRYETPPQHHNPLELFQATCVWEDDALTLYESSQSVLGYQHGLAKQLDIPVKKIRVLSPVIGGAFGARGELGQATALMALAAKRIGRPVKFVGTRQQAFTLRTFRAETRQHVQLAADEKGLLTGIRHEGWELTSRDDPYAVAGIDATTRLYACKNIEARVYNVTADRQTPGFMRAPPELPYMFAFESAMDELAWSLLLDPIELRRRNDTQIDPLKGVPFSTRNLMPCFDAASARFGWQGRPLAPRSMRDGDWLVGWGCASSVYPSQIAPASCRVTFDGTHATIETSASDVGTGAYTIFAQTAADALGIDARAVTVRLADSTLPAAPLTAGSNTSASVCSAIAKACQELLADSDFESGKITERETWHIPDGTPPIIGPSVIRSGRALIVPGTHHKKWVQFAFGAQLVEVRVNAYTGEVRVPRLVGAFAAGRIMNPRTARSQIMGGQIWGMESALLEATEIDKRSARYLNNNLAEYHIAVQADVGEVTSIFVEESDDKVNPLGIKGLGELGLVGGNAALANAIFHATGVRIRKLPIRVEQLLPPDDATEGAAGGVL